MEYVLCTEQLTKQYRRFRALDRLSMHVEKGAIYGLVGRNGAGKTTLIRLICGLQRPSSGSFTLYGQKNTDRGLSRARRRMGAVVETPSIYLDMTAEENLMQQFRILGLPSFGEIPELLNLAGLTGTGRKKARHFSLGMRQRLGIAVALAGRPDFLILDEPANGLDPQGIVEIRELILRLNREREITVLISSHILDELSRLATHYGFLDRGQMLQETSAEKLEAACRKCTRIQVSNVQALARVLEQMQITYTIRSDTQADLYGAWNVTDLTLALSEQNCQVLKLSARDESLESYYMSLMGGNEHDETTAR